MQVSTTMSSSNPAAPVEKGVAGRINYAAWDKVATDLVDQVDREEQEEIAAEKAKVRSANSLTELTSCVRRRQDTLYSSIDLVGLFLDSDFVGPFL